MIVEDSDVLDETHIVILDILTTKDLFHQPLCISMRRNQNASGSSLSLLCKNLTTHLILWFHGYHVRRRSDFRNSDFNKN